ncbi:hypothetical protein [Clostridium omnivorum]|uniref:Lipoprotein n=1 Tax=Clostridium omnivorum TaxID=1604902 RepID=A0ABQ5NC15_9CLOT|nr:hypothetical protein [Clostridium sp. E14]GLC32617.1 hypothetical protein bsdE14_40270 [Clostridium sp. E14]
MKSNYKVNWQKVPLIPLAALLIILLVFVWWLNSSSPTPKDAILKYCRKNELKYYRQNFKISQTKIIDKDYGKQFIVDGVKGELGDNIIFFYLKDDKKGWKVICAGTGP